MTQSIDIDENSQAEGTEKLIDKPDERPTLSIDMTKFLHFLDEASLDDARKIELLEVYWHIIVGFVDLGFRFDQPRNGCGQNREQASKITTPPAGVIKSNNILPAKQFSKAADPSPAKAVERSDS